MANINLRPWRAELREELKQQFLGVLGLVALGGALLAGLGLFMLNSAIDYQQTRNSFLKQEIAVLNKRIEEIKSLKAERERLKERMRVIQELQGNRPIIVRIFDELARTLPDGVWYGSVRRTGEQLQLAGTAESNNKVSSLMRRFEKSDWFANPVLSGVTANASVGEEASNFDMRVNRVSPKTEEDKNKN